MSDHLSAAAQALGIPESLAARSAQARAAASGTTAEAVLEAWAGGGSVANAGAAAEPVAPIEQPNDTSAPPPEPTPVAEPAPAVAPTAVATLEPAPAPVLQVSTVGEEEAVVAASLSERLHVATRTGAVTGLFLGLIGWVFAVQYLFTTSSLSGEEGAITAALDVEAGRFVFGSILISIAIGLAVAGLARLVPSWAGPGMRLTGSGLPTAALGILGGATVGAIGGSLVTGLGTPIETMEGFTSVPVLPALIWSMLVWAAGGWLIGALVQAIGVPNGVEPGEAGEVSTVKARLISAFGLPVVATLAILALVLSFAFVFISFPSWAPLTGTVLAGSILGFAALSASKPSMRVGVGELLVAAAGIGVVVLLIYAVLNATGQGHGEEEPHNESDVSTALVI